MASSMRRITGMEKAEIKRISDFLSDETKDQDKKVVLASLEYKARKCKKCIEERLAVRN